MQHKGFSPATKSNTAEDFNTSLVLCLRVVSVKGTVPIWPCVCWMSYWYAPSFPVSVPKGATTQPTWAASTIVLPPQCLATWQIFFSGGVADRCSVVTARYVILFLPYTPLIQQGWNFVAHNSSQDWPGSLLTCRAEIEGCWHVIIAWYPQNHPRWVLHVLNSVCWFFCWKRRYRVQNHSCMQKQSIGAKEGESKEEEIEKQ